MSTCVALGSTVNTIIYYNYTYHTQMHEAAKWTTLEISHSNAVKYINANHLHGKQPVLIKFKFFIHIWFHTMLSSRFLLH